MIIYASKMIGVSCQSCSSLGLTLATTASVRPSALPCPVAMPPTALGGPIGSGCYGNINVFPLSLFISLLGGVTEHLLEEAESREK